VNENAEHILLVDDDATLAELLKEYLEESGLTVSCAENTDEAIQKIDDKKPDLIVLDVMMPGMSGLEFLSIVRSRWALPVIMLTGRGEDIDRILGLEMGADDYLTKPCNPRELLARIRAVLRRTPAVQEVTAVNEPELELSGVVLNRNARSVFAGGAKLSLTTAEFDVLAVLMDSAGEAVSRDVLTEKVLHRKLSAYDRSVDVHVSRVRNALREAIPDEDLIVTIRGVGYQFVR